MVRPSTPWNEELQGLKRAGHESRTRQPAAKTPLSFFSTHRSVRLHGSSNLYQQSTTTRSIFEHASILSPSIRSPHGSANGYASMETCLLFALYLLRALDRSGNFGTRSRSSHERAAELETFVAFLFSCCQAVYQVKKKQKKTIYSTANYSTAHTTKKQHHTALNPTNTKINNSTTIHFFFTAMTPPYNSKTAIQYHMIYNNCPLFAPLAKHPLPFLPQIRPLRQVANKLHGYIYSALATYFYAGIYLHADINGHLLRRYSHDHLEQILNTSDVEILHHLVLATQSLLRDVQNKY